MKLLDSLFSIVSASSEDGRHVYTIRINPEHFIYKAHFPGEPITPGVCIMQIAIELMSETCGHPLVLKCAKNIKFLKVISPAEVMLLDCTLDKFTEDDDTVSCQISVTAGGTVYAKLSLACSISE